MLFRRVHALSAGATKDVASCLSTGALLTSCRRLHMPPGGFDEPLPPTFGRQQGKGELSHTNLRKKKQKRRLLQRHKQRLPLEALQGREPGVSLAKIKQELLALGERSERTLKGPRQPTIRVLDGSATEAGRTATHPDHGEEEGHEGEASSPVAGSTAYAHRLAAPGVAHEVVEELADDEDDLGGGRSGRRSLHGAGAGSYARGPAAHPEADRRPGTLLDRTVSASERANTHSEVFALAEVAADTATSSITPTLSPSGIAARARDRSPDGLIASAVESHWHDYREADISAEAAAVAMERRFAVSPRSTVLGSDLDRLERDMLREHHQHLERQPPLDDVYVQFGGGRRAKRMQWQPSSSFESLDKSDFAANRASEFTLGDTENRNLSPYHMYAEAYRETQHDAHAAQQRRQQQARREAGRGINYTRSLSDRMGGPVPGEEAAAATAVGRADGDEAEAPATRPAAENPHFPVMSEDADTAPSGEATDDAAMSDELDRTRDRLIEIDARRDYRPRLVVRDTPLMTADAQGVDDDGENDHRILYDAYRQRPADNRLVATRGADYWDDPEHRQAIEDRGALRRDAFELEKLQQGAMDTSEVEYSVNKVRKETFLYFQSHPINEMIQEPFVRIRRVLPKGGAEGIYYDPFDPYEGSVDLAGPSATAASASAAQTPTAALAAADDTDAEPTSAVAPSTSLRFHMDVDIPVQDARRMAQELGLDLVRIGAIHTQKSDRRIVALCMLADHREHMRDMIKFKIQKLGVQPPPTKECIEVPFTGGIHPHAIRFKAVGIAKHLLHRHAIRLNLTKFGTPREGFPVFQSILDEVKRQCLRLKAYHKAGEIQADYNEIYCYLYPSTGRSPKTTVDHPSPAQVRATQDFRILENEKEVYFDDLMAKGSVRERLTYLTKLEKGTAWAEKDEGMSLQRQRALKVMLGYLPKGNNELYRARGDVNIPAPFRSSHPTSVSAWSSPQESNLEQASRGAAALGKRASMAISEMHDLDETPENPTQLDRFYYRVQGPALEVGEFKEALGLKDNRRKRPALAPGFATLGMQNGGRSEQPTWEATK